MRVREARVREARRLAAVYNDANIATDELEYVQKFDGGMMNVVFAWCNGASFAALCEMCDLFEGSIIRAFRRCLGVRTQRHWHRPLLLIPCKICFRLRPRCRLEPFELHAG